MSSARLRFTTANVASGAESLDRVIVDEVDDALLVVLADGAGGMTGGAAAADAFINARASCSMHDVIASRGQSAVAWIEAVDRSIARSAHGGECTAVVAVVHGNLVVGASVGDSCAWICGDEGVIDLTESQRRKPLVGSGRATAVAFVSAMSGGRLLIASDGLWKYAAREAINAAANADDIEAAAVGLVDLVRLPSRGLQDDVSFALVVCATAR